MSGTDRTQEAVTGGPVIILIEPQLGENVGASARAMLNCGLIELRLVRPRDGWPSVAAERSASGADEVIEGVVVFDNTEAAIGDLNHVYAASARRRDMIQAVLTPRAAAHAMRNQMTAGGRCGVLFGPERAGLDNDDMVLADTVIEAPLNPAYSSLNLSQAVLLVAYEWFQAGIDLPSARVNEASSRPANKAELMDLFDHLESELDKCGFLRVAEKRPSMVRNLRNIFQRAGLMEQEVRTLRGVIAGLTARRGEE